MRQSMQPYFSTVFSTKFFINIKKDTVNKIVLKLYEWVINQKIEFWLIESVILVSWESCVGMTVPTYTWTVSFNWLSVLKG